MITLTWPPKDPNEVLDYSIDWSQRLNGDVINASSWTVGGTLVAANTSFSNTVSTVWLSGGTANSAPLSCKCQITTLAGRTMDQSVQIVIQNK